MPQPRRADSGVNPSGTLAGGTAPQGRDRHVLAATTATIRRTASFFMFFD
jgi:hypothetical protein